jgi:hypothetical protein
MLMSVLLFGCAQPEPQDIVACATLPTQTAIEDCRYRLAAPHLTDPAALRADLAQIADPISHDLLLQRLSVNHPAQAGALCRQMKTEQGRQKCQQVIGRPHLSTRPR